MLVDRHQQKPLNPLGSKTHCLQGAKNKRQTSDLPLFSYTIMHTEYSRNQVSLDRYP